MKTIRASNVNNFIIFFVSFIGLSVNALKIDKTDNDPAKDINQINDKLDISKVNKLKTAYNKAITPTADKNKINFSSQELLAQPKLLQQLLENSIVTNNLVAIQTLLDIYQRYPQKDPNLVLIAQASINKLKNNYKQAIEQYRKVIANRPDYNSIRLSLAICLFEDNQYEAAENQFNKIKSEPNNPAQIVDLVASYLNAIKQSDRWKVNFNLSYLKDNNVNNAPQKRSYGNFIFEEPKKASGFLYNSGVSREINIKGNNYLNIDLSANGKKYFGSEIDNKYSNHTIHSGLGWLYKDLTSNFTIIPFAELSWQGGYQDQAGQKYTINKDHKSYGVEVDYNKWLTNNIELFTNNLFSSNRYFKRKYFNGKNTYNDLGVLYLKNPQLLFNSKIYFSKNKAQGDEDSYKRYGIQFGATKEWDLGLSNALILTYSQKKYKGIDLFQILRKDKEKSVTISLWHRAISFYGITPKLNISFTKVNSNHLLYSSNSLNAYLNFSKTF